MIVGLGGIGSAALELLCRVPSVSKIVAVDPRKEYGQQKVNVAACGAYQMGYYPDVEFRRMDLTEDVSKNTEIINEVAPRVILHCATMLTWWIRHQVLPPEVLKPLESVSGEGPWLPVQLRLVYELMKAVDASEVAPLIINSSFADAVNPALATQGLTATVGMGNLDTTVALAQKQIADQTGLKARDIRIYHVAHHYESIWLSNGAPEPPLPYFTKIFIDSKDVTAKYDVLQLLINAQTSMVVPFTGADPLMASSLVKHALALLNDTREFTHAPGPNGLPGGYPIRLGYAGAELVLPEGITREEAIAINLEGQRRDGIEEIRDDGTVVYPDEVVEAMKKVLNFECKSFKVADVAKVAGEQKAKFNELVSEYGKI